MNEIKASDGVAFFNLILKGRKPALVLAIGCAVLLVGTKHLPKWLAAMASDVPQQWAWVPELVLVCCIAVLLLDTLAAIYQMLKRAAAKLRMTRLEQRPLTNAEHYIMQACYWKDGQWFLNYPPTADAPSKVHLDEAAESLRERGLIESVSMDSDYVCLSGKGRRYVLSRLQDDGGKNTG
ncbi:hypothetical protein [Burkholderia sp. BCC1640]|uniref:hypothetical protein n=1 Tax=Burkholderia sp. BCC1640 TaxID=2676294 RepID=UPI00158CDA92|nr:hypothetical protein [Burkholderia sp. BCC1640]